MEEYEYEEEFVEYDPVNGPIEAVESGSNTESEEEFVEYDPAGEDYDPVNDRMGHVVAVWRDLTLVWGGFFDGQVYADQETYDEKDMWNPSVVYTKTAFGGR